MEYLIQGTDATIFCEMVCECFSDAYSPSYCPADVCAIDLCGSQCGSNMICGSGIGEIGIGINSVKNDQF